MPRMKTEDRQHLLSQTRQRLMDAAAVEFAQSGYDGANINTISITAGYAKGTIYNYFASKRELILALVEEIAQQHYEVMTTQVRQVLDPIRRLEQLYAVGFDFVSVNLPRMRVMLTLIYGTDWKLKEHIFERYQPLFRFVSEEVVGYGMTQGVFRPVDPVKMGTLLLTIYLGTASHITDSGYYFIPASEVAEFARQSLCKE